MEILRRKPGVAGGGRVALRRGAQMRQTYISRGRWGRYSLFIGRRWRPERSRRRASAGCVSRGSLRPPVLARGSEPPPNLPREIANCTVIDNMDLRNTTFFSISTAQALFARAGVSRFLRTRSAANRGGKRPETSVDTSNCYACAMGRAMALVYSGGRNDIATESNSLRSVESRRSSLP